MEGMGSWLKTAPLSPNQMSTFQPLKSVNIDSTKLRILRLEDFSWFIQVDPT